MDRKKTILTGDSFSPKIKDTEAIYNEISHFINCIEGQRCISGIEFSEKIVGLILDAEKCMNKKNENENEKHYKTNN